ncbi:MAG TPA: bifunctional nuclease family protein [Thermoanaerobaculia bacterium]|nr:bifunctional nuclease family protein [Thermoanaerobaculia bacterium]
MSDAEGTGPVEDTVQMEVKGLMLDPSSNVPIVILRDLEKTLFLPIWIGMAEAQAIALRIEGVQTPRPLTHDLVLQAILKLGASVEKIVVSNLEESTFYAEIHLQQGGELVRIDARPSDAIAVALRAEAPIFVRRAVLEKAQAVSTGPEPSDEERLKKWLEELDPEDLGRYTM